MIYYGKRGPIKATNVTAARLLAGERASLRIRMLLSVLTEWALAEHHGQFAAEAELRATALLQRFGSRLRK